MGLRRLGGEPREERPMLESGDASQIVLGYLEERLAKLRALREKFAELEDVEKAGPEIQRAIAIIEGATALALRLGAISKEQAREILMRAQEDLDAETH